MTGSEFIKAGQKITGKGTGYQQPFADRLGVRVLTVKRYAAGHRKIPCCIANLIRELLKSC